jgi:hypothetical protein
VNKFHIQKQTKVALFFGLAVGALGASSASAHHSFAMFDSQKKITLEGTVRAFQWTNPHSWIQLAVPDASGKEVEWALEGASPNVLVRAGWKRTTLKPGDKVTAVLNPLKDGTPGGSWTQITVNGVQLKAR